MPPTHSAIAEQPAFNVFDPRFKRDPHPLYAKLRVSAPVQRVLNPDGRVLYLVTRYDDALQVLKDPRFSKHHFAVRTAASGEPLPALPPAMRFLTRHLLVLDPPDHTRLRALVRTAFTARLVEGLRPRIQAIADALLATVAPQGRMDLIEDYAFPLPITVIAELLGIPGEDHALFRRWSAVLVTHAGSLDSQAMATVTPVLEGLAAYLRELFETKRLEPCDDLTTALLRVEAAGATLSEDELIAMLLLLIIAGHETTVNLIGNGMLALLQHPDQLVRLKQEPQLIAAAVEELLRYDGPVETSTLRYTREAVEIGGVTIPKDNLVLVVLTSANRDAARFAQPDTLDITRSDNRHLAFGHGIHFCLGAALARLEGQIAIGTLLQRMPQLRLDADPAALSWRLGLLIRGLNRLPVAF